MKLEPILNRIREPEFDEIIVACHQNPDGDAVGSAYGLAYGLRKMGKKARAFCKDPIGADFAYITAGEDELCPFSARHFITVDVASPELLGTADFDGRIDIAIDHHRVNSVSAPLKFVDAESASCGEIVLELLRALGVEMDAYLASALYTAVATDTGCFRYSNTNENTFLAAAFLSRFAGKGDFYRINKCLFETKSKKKLGLEAWAIENVQLENGGRAAYLAVTLQDMAGLNAALPELDGMINVIRQIEGVEVAVVIKQKEENLFKVSVRSEESFDAASFCAVFGGGGHKAAAGCSLPGPLADTRQKLRAEITRRLS